MKFETWREFEQKIAKNTKENTLRPLRPSVRNKRDGNGQQGVESDMNKEEILSEIKNKLGDKIVDWFEKSPRRYYVEVKPNDVPDATRLIFKELGARFQIASGVDTPSAIEILYHWGFDALNFIVTVRTKLNREKPEIESVASICNGTEWIEREMWELLGIKFRNHPDMRHLLLLDDWPEGKYPLRRDYSG